MKGFAGALLTDFSKAFDCISHESLISWILMASSIIHYMIHLAISVIDTKGSMRSIVRGQKFTLEYLKVRYWGHCCLTYNFLIYFYC